MAHPHEKFLFTSESVTEGHPDKMADEISDAVLDTVLTHDPMGRVGCETLVTTGLVVIAGEITIKKEARGVLEYERIARDVINEIGYNRAKYGFDAETCGILSAVKPQSPDIAMGVDTGGAGDQGMMFGYACDETPELMPMPIKLAHQLTFKLAQVRKAREVDFFRPDAKSQVSIEYVNGKPARVDTVVISTQHSDQVSQSDLREAVIEKVIKPVIPAHMFDKDTKIHVNPTGRFVTGGPMGDAGLTGRKIIVELTAAMDATAAVHFPAKILEGGPLRMLHGALHREEYRRCGPRQEGEVQLAYAIGVAEPVSVMADTFGTGTIPNPQITEIVRALFKLTPKGIIETLDLRRPIYRPTAAYGHFGRTGPGFTWERTDKADAIRKEAGTVAMARG